MSYNIIKALRVTADNKVIIKSAESNLFPITFDTFEAKGLTGLLQEKGRVALDKRILRLYAEGAFQKTGNLYEKSTWLLKHNDPQWCKGLNAEEEEEKLYQNYLKYKRREKGTFIITHKKFPLEKVSKNYLYYAPPGKRAKQFSSKEDAMYYLRHHDNESDNLEIVNLEETMKLSA